MKNLKQNQNTDKSILTNRSENKSTVEKLASIASVKPTLYKMGAKVLSSDDEELKQEVLSGDKSINAAYKELTQKNMKRI